MQKIIIFLKFYAVYRFFLHFYTFSIQDLRKNHLYERYDNNQSA